jgi:DNA-binding CsgD family transcriptional regulator
MNQFEKLLLQRRWEQGVAVKAIADELDCATSTVYAYLRLLTIPKQHSRLKKRLSSKNQDIIERYKSGASLAAIGREYNITRQAVFSIVRRYGVRVAKSKKIEERNQELARLYVAGHSVDELATLFDVSPRMLGSLLKPQSKRLQQRNRQIVWWRKVGYSIKELADLFDLHPSAICSILQRDQVAKILNNQRIYCWTSPKTLKSGGEC